jgi:hypothetical protein
MRAAILAGIVILAGGPALGRTTSYDHRNLGSYLTSERAALVRGHSSDTEKIRAARYGLNEPDNDFFEPVPHETRFRWRLNRVKLRVPFSTTGAD